MPRQTEIAAPLWDLLLSTNDCFPGCGCNDDFFDLTPERISQWAIGESPETVSLAFRQAARFTAEVAEDGWLNELAQQTNMVFEPESDAVVWTRYLEALLRDYLESTAT